VRLARARWLARAKRIKKRFRASSPQSKPDSAFASQEPALDRKAKDTVQPEEEGRLLKAVDMRRRSIHVNKGRKDQYDYQG
jgi:hypothetical protein